MSLSDRQIRRVTEERVVTIDEVNVAAQHISARDQYGTTIIVSLDLQQPIVIVPQQGEQWIVERYNTSWRLKQRHGKGAGDITIQGDNVNIDGNVLINGSPPGGGGSGIAAKWFTGTKAALDTDFPIPSLTSDWIPFYNTSTNDGAIFSTTNRTSILGGSVPTIINLNAAGIYIVMSGVLWATTNNFSRYAQIEAAGTMTFPLYTAFSNLAQVPYTAGGTSLGSWLDGDVNMILLNGADTLSVRAFNGDTVTRSIHQASIGILYFPTS